MWPFKKKKDPPLINRCEHKYREFDWYMTTTLSVIDRQANGEVLGNVTVEIYKPYVCIHCKHRKDILLNKRTRVNATWFEAKKFDEDVREEYKGRIKPSAEVVEQIADFQLIDREYLKMAHELFPDRGILKEEPNEH